MTRPWPWHPPPHPGEALTSWLARLAAGYAMTAEELLAEPGAPAFSPSQHARLDVQAPDWVSTMLAAGTGTPAGEIAALTFAGQVPWLADTITTDDTAEGYHTFVEQFSVLLPPRRRPPRPVTGWRAWLPDRLLTRACPQCCEQPGWSTSLLSRIPITLSCPTHHCRLEDCYAIGLSEPYWAEEGPKPGPVSDAVAAMDTRTWQALTTGAVDLPERTVHAAVWFRLLRCLLHEVNTPLGGCTPNQAAVLRLVWEHAGHPYRAGQSFWRPYEKLDWAVQQRMLEAAASAVHLAETRAIPARGTDGHLLAPPPAPPVSDGVRCRPTFGQALEQAVAAARTDPQAARQLLAVCTLGSANPKIVGPTIQTMIEAGIPPEYLPPQPPPQDR